MLLCSVPCFPAAAEIKGYRQGRSRRGKVLTVYTARSESLNNLVIPAFEKETGIKVNVIVAGTGPLVKRVASEKDNPQGDILWAADQTMLDSQKELLRNMYLRKTRI